MSNPHAENWHLDKRVPISIIFTIMLQLGVFVWAWANLDSKVSDHDRRIVVAETTLADLGRGNTLLVERLARVETLLQAQLEMARRIESKLDRGFGNPQ